MTMSKMLVSAAHFRHLPTAPRCLRQSLVRVWDGGRPVGMFIGANPGQANEVDNDATVRKYIGFGQRWGWGGFVAGNLAQWISTDMKAFIARAAAGYPVNPDDPDEWLRDAVDNWKITIACLAWGNTPPKIRTLWECRTREVYQELRRLSVSTVVARHTKRGAPAHLSRLGYTPAPCTCCAPLVPGLCRTSLGIF